uniref:Uncharacterized protein n=1 Tax=Gorilla gorilla gorilla TaxID=9595 RepID=A0A2I2ZAA0_GORGO
MVFLSFSSDFFLYSSFFLFHLGSIEKLETAGEEPLAFAGMKACFYPRMTGSRNSWERWLYSLFTFDQSQCWLGWHNKSHSKFRTKSPYQQDVSCCAYVFFFILLFLDHWLTDLSESSIFFLTLLLAQKVLP